MANRQSLDPRYLVGDATEPTGEGIRIVAHVCNDAGAWGAGFVLALSRRWREPERAYRSLRQEERKLGTVRYVDVEPGLLVANMVAQEGIGPQDGRPPIRYGALADCLTAVGTRAAELDASVHMPRIGCGLAGGRWSKIEPILRSTLCERGVSVFVYLLPNDPAVANPRGVADQQD